MSEKDEHLECLLLEDETEVGIKLGEALEKAGCKVEVFDDPILALRRITEKRFHIVITDIFMEGMDGLQVLEKVMEKHPQTKVIMITGYAMMEMARKAMEKGAFDFIEKPFKPKELCQGVARAAKDLGMGDKIKC